MRIGPSILIAAAVGGMSGTAIARDIDRNGSIEITKGDYAGAERTITAERRVFPDHADLTLNLASIYARAGRVGEARALYREVLRRADEQVVLTNDRSYSSHALATVALQRIERSQLTAR